MPVHSAARMVCLALALFAACAGVTAAEPTAVVETIAGNGRDEFTGDKHPALEGGCGQPFGLTIGPDGALYVCETTNHIIRRIDLKTGEASVVAGTGRKAGYAGDGGPATSALLNEPYEVVERPNALIFVEMKNHLIRWIDLKTHVISTLAGDGEPGFDGDHSVEKPGDASRSRFRQPHSLCFMPGSADLLVCDIGNHRVRILGVMPKLLSGERDDRTVIATFTGNGQEHGPRDGEPIESAAVFGPRAVCPDPRPEANGTGVQGGNRGHVIFALREGNQVFRMNLKTERFEHLAGVGGKNGYKGDGGPAKEATLAGPKGVAVAPDGDIYLADTESHTVRVIRKKTGIIETVVGTGKAGDGPDGDPRQCRLDRPHGVHVDKDGTLYIGDSNNNKVRRVRFNNRSEN